MSPTHKHTFRQTIGFDTTPGRSEANTRHIKYEPSSVLPTPRLSDSEIRQRIYQFSKRPGANAPRSRKSLQMGIKSPAVIFESKPVGTLAICPAGNYLVRSQVTSVGLTGLTGFHVKDPEGKRLGTIEIKIIENPGEDCAALTWIDKGDLKQGCTLDFAMWHLTNYTKKRHVEVRNVLNQEIGNHLFKYYGMFESADNDLRGDKDHINNHAKRRLVQRGWLLAE